MDGSLSAEPRAGEFPAERAAWVWVGLGCPSSLGPVTRVSNGLQEDVLVAKPPFRKESHSQAQASCTVAC